MEEEMRSINFGIYWAESVRQIFDKRDLSGYWRGISSEGDFLGVAPSYTLIRNPLLRLCHRLIVSSIAGRSHAPENVAPGPEMQPNDAAGALVDVEGDHVKMARHEEEVHMIQESLDEHHKVMDTMARDFSRVRRRTDDASTSAVLLDEHQPDP
nr:hypothetical protein [Tanacetum cinerariifolium]